MYIFLEQEFDEEAFENLDYETLKSIIPKAGPRQKFWTAYKKIFLEEVCFCILIFLVCL